MATAGAADVEGLWQKLRRRKVVQWGIAYVAAAWGFLQGLEYASEAFGWPGQLRQVAILALLIGLPIVLVLAWYHGDRGEQRVRGTELAIITLLFLVGGGIFWRYDRTNDTPLVAESTTAQPAAPTTVVDTRPSIAVLPFENRSDEQKDAFFVDGIHDDILTQLSKVSALKVISRTSVEQIRGTKLSIKEIAQKLGVTKILEGGVQRAGDRVRIHVQLIDANTDANLWAESYDRELTVANIFAIQSEVASAISAALKATLTPAERARMSTIPTQNLAAWEAYQLGKQRMAKRTSTGLAEAERLFQEAIDRDPDFALAYVGLADTVRLQVSYSGGSLEPSNARAEELIKRALTLAPDLPEAITTSAHLTSDESEFQRAIALNPNYATAHHWYSILLLDLGRRNEALRQVQIALELDPISTIIISHSAETLVALGRFDEALAQYRKVIAIDPTMPFAYWGVADVYHLGLGRLDVAIPWVEKSVSLDSGNPAHTTYLAALYLSIGDEARAGRWLERALEHGAGLVWAHEVAAMFNLYRGDRGVSQAHARTAAALDSRHIRHLVAADVRRGDYAGARARYAKAYPNLLASELPSIDGARSLASEIPTIDGALPFAAIDLAVVLQHTGEEKRATELLDRSEAVIRTMPRMGRSGYGVADVAIHALRGETAQALTGLHEAEQAGWLGVASEAGDWHWRYERDFDPALASIRHEPEFKAVFARIEARMATQRARLAARPKDAPLELTEARR